jgi:hypothetical protein
VKPIRLRWRNGEGDGDEAAVTLIDRVDRNRWFLEDRYPNW